MVWPFIPSVLRSSPRGLQLAMRSTKLAQKLGVAKARPAAQDDTLPMDASTEGTVVEARVAAQHFVGSDREDVHAQVSIGHAEMTDCDRGHCGLGPEDDLVVEIEALFAPAP